MEEAGDVSSLQARLHSNTAEHDKRRVNLSSALFHTEVSSNCTPLYHTTSFIGSFIGSFVHSLASCSHFHVLSH